MLVSLVQNGVEVTSIYTKSVWAFCFSRCRTSYYNPTIIKDINYVFR